MATNRGSTPVGPSWRPHKLSIEPPRDRTRVFARYVFLKNASHDLGLDRDDLGLAGFARDRAVPVGPPAGMPTVTDHPHHTSADRGLEIVEKLRIDDRAQPVHERRDDAIGRRYQLDPGESETFADGRRVFLVAGDAR